MTQCLEQFANLCESFLIPCEWPANYVVTPGQSRGNDLAAGSIPDYRVILE